MTELEKLQQIIAGIEKLISNGCDANSVDFKQWKNKAELFIARKYGQESLDYKQFKGIKFYTIDISEINGWGKRIDHVKECQEGLLIAKEKFQEYLDDMKENADEEQPKVLSQQLNYKKIFIVHGHDGELRESIARVIEKQSIEAIILSEQANQGKTIIEKVEKYSDVGGAVCLFTADDLGKKKTDKEDHSRARQNVVFEAGYFMGKLGRDHIVILADEGVELPSDLSGIVYTNVMNWQLDLLKELKSMGYQIDVSKLLE